LQSLLAGLHAPTRSSPPDAAVVNTLSLKAEKLAQALTARRYFCETDSSGQRIVFDPRFLMFEFTYNLLLRESQVELVTSIIEGAHEKHSSCHQMIMGAGKTTVVGPLLALLLADGKRLFTQVVPRSLLEFSRGIMRERFSAVIRKPVYTFTFDRFRTVSLALYRKVLKAKESKAVLVSTSTAVKAFQLKFVELVHLLEQAATEKRTRSDKEIKKMHKEAKELAKQGVTQKPARLALWEMVPQLREQAEICIRVLDILKAGSLIIDEVDLVLHPLKSELNFPIGKKEPLDLTLNKKQKGLRWELPMHLLDALFYTQLGRMSVPLHASREADNILKQIKGVVEIGFQKRHLQKTPHFVLLSRNWYHRELKPLLAKWVVIWLSFGQTVASGLNDDQMLKYLLLKKEAGTSAAAPAPQAGKATTAGPSMRDRARAIGVKEELLSDDFLKLLNISHDWLHTLLPFVLGKIDRVSFGLLNDRELKKALELDPRMPKSRRVTAVPFVGKDVPSSSSEFSHPDVVIGLTILAYRHEGVRRSDFKKLMVAVQAEMWEEVGCRCVLGTPSVWHCWHVAIVLNVVLPLLACAVLFCRLCFLSYP